MRNLHVEDVGALAGDHVFERRIEVVFLGNAGGATAETFGQSHEIGIGSFVRAGAQISMSAVALEEAIFPLGYHAQVLIVDRAEP